MKKKFIKYTLIIVGIFMSAIIYLSIIGLETEKFNKQIKDKIKQTNNRLDLKLKKIKLTLDPLNFTINAKTIGAQIIYQQKILKLEYIKTQVSLISIIKNKLVSSNLEISTKSILLKDLVRFARSITNRTELFLLERMINNGHVILKVNLNFDAEGKVKDDYTIDGILKDGTVNVLKNYEFDKINFYLNIRNNILNLKDISFITNKINFFSNNIQAKKNNEGFTFEGLIENKNSTLNDNLRELIKGNYGNIYFGSKNNFSFKIDNKLKFKDLLIESEIDIDELEYRKPKFINEHFPNIENNIYLKNHKIKAVYSKNRYSLNGSGKIKLQKEFDTIEYTINNKNKDFNLSLKIALSKLDLKNQKFFKIFFPEINEKSILKNHQIEINYNKDNLSLKGFGKIQLEKEFNKINYSFSKSSSKLNFDTMLNLNQTLFEVDYFNYKKNKKLDTKLIVTGSYEKNNKLSLRKIIIQDEDNQITLDNLLMSPEKKILKVDKIDLNYLDAENKRNKFFIQRKGENDYELKGMIFNANGLISDLFKKDKDSKKAKIFNNDVNLSLDLMEVNIDEKSIVRNFKGNVFIKDNVIYQTSITALFDENENLTFTINTSNGEKITTLFSSRAKPLVKRYKFIKGYEEGYLDFYSFEKNNISNSILKIYDFKLQELPTLTKLLTLASLQGIADILSGEGIRFNEFEMNFNIKDDLMTIDEIYAIGPAISILMSGYIEKDKLVSLRGTLVPATTINKSISNIPILGKILVGDKIGEGVFGVSFKIKGLHNNLVTTVNPIKTLTPRFITRTLEKIKKN